MILRTVPFAWYDDDGCSRITAALATGAAASAANTTAIAAARFLPNNLTLLPPFRSGATCPGAVRPGRALPRGLAKVSGCSSESATLGTQSSHGARASRRERTPADAVGP